MSTSKTSKLEKLRFVDSRSVLKHRRIVKYVLKVKVFAMRLDQVNNLKLLLGTTLKLLRNAKHTHCLATLHVKNNKMARNFWKAKD